MNRILVIGDVMLDRYWQGEVTRLSEEAPVPVVRMGNEEHRAGAAANVAMNCAAMGAPVTLVGIVGKDDSAEILRGIVQRAGIKQLLLADGSIKTTQKLRVIGRGQQIVRIDFEQRPLVNMVSAGIMEINAHDIIVFSDYDKGALAGIEQLIQHAKATGKTVLVDPKGFDWSKYAYADLIKPNVHEMRDLAGGWKDEYELEQKAKRIMHEGHIERILLTRGSGGMSLYGGANTAQFASQAREVFDVTGAGDTVIAGVASMLARNATLTEAVRIANIAAGIAVGKFGTSVVTWKEIEAAL